MISHLYDLQEEDSSPTDPSPSPSNKEEDSQDTRVRASSQTSQNSSPPGVGTGDFSQAATAFSDPQGPGNLRLDDESEYPPLTVHND